MKIISYRIEDHDALTDIWLRAVRQTHHFLSEEDIAFYHRLVRDEALQAVELWTALGEDGKPAGFIGLDGAKVEMLFVDPERHGRGIGRRLLDHAAELKGRGLSVDVNEQNEAALAFYKRYGFVQTGRSELDGSGRPFPLLHLALAPCEKLPGGGSPH
ncbi:putative acetyltransferase [Paenibacillus sp. UNCCL117]|uniref:acetyltransferase n=1 Tax=unclassified Paenibacillus TaxID=185978 RepID=UPI0008811BBD|nr:MULTISPECIES: acetyltransferase [unclassified Paenibacillus]SDE46147.1 putative acetyltransferase [Paenibacillus sp. cl123]SFW65917.1 putative acetyltransferase [Paenibacillus sp. UNCCL117]